MGIEAGIDIVQRIAFIRHHTICCAFLQFDLVWGVVFELVAGGEAGQRSPTVLVLDTGKGSFLAIGGNTGGIGLSFGQGEILRGWNINGRIREE